MVAHAAAPATTHPQAHRAHVLDAGVRASRARAAGTGFVGATQNLCATRQGLSALFMAVSLRCCKFSAVGPAHKWPRPTQNGSPTSGAPPSTHTRTHTPRRTLHTPASQRPACCAAVVQEPTTSSHVSVPALQRLQGAGQLLAGSQVTCGQPGKRHSSKRQKAAFKLSALVAFFVKGIRRAVRRARETFVALRPPGTCQRCTARPSCRVMCMSRPRSGSCRSWLRTCRSCGGTRTMWESLVAGRVWLGEAVLRTVFSVRAHSRAGQINR